MDKEYQALHKEAGASASAPLNPSLTDLQRQIIELIGAETFDALAKAGVIHENLAMQLKKAVGFRNIAVHNYRKIDWTIVHTIARHRLGDFTEFAKVIASRLAR